jgi:hypothetical protein
LTTRTARCAHGLLEAFGDLPEVGTEAVVSAASVRILEYLVRLVDLLELLFGAGVLVHVGVVAPRELAVGLLDLVGTRGSRHSQHLVVVAGHRRHSGSPATTTTTAAGRSCRVPCP